MNTRANVASVRAYEESVQEADRRLAIQDEANAKLLLADREWNAKGEGYRERADRAARAARALYREIGWEQMATYCERYILG